MLFDRCDSFTPRPVEPCQKRDFVGELANTHPTTLGATLVNAMLERNPDLPPEKIEDLIYATTIAVKEQAQDIARWIVLASKLPVVTTSGVHFESFLLRRPSGQRFCQRIHPGG